MRNFYPKIKFIYSLPYDRLLTEYENKFFNEKQAKEIRKYIRALQSQWNKINNSVCHILEKTVKNRWKAKEIKCYIVKHCRISGFSDPLTIKFDPDFDFLFDTLIHELIHIFVSYDFKKYKKIEQKLKRQFPRENQRTILHIYIIFIELQVIRELFKPAHLNKAIKRIKTFKGIKRALDIVLAQENDLKKLLKL